MDRIQTGGDRDSWDTLPLGLIKLPLLALIESEEEWYQGTGVCNASNTVGWGHSFLEVLYLQSILFYLYHSGPYRYLDFYQRETPGKMPLVFLVWRLFGWDLFCRGRWDITCVTTVCLCCATFLHKWTALSLLDLLCKIEITHYPCCNQLQFLIKNVQKALFTCVVANFRLRQQSTNLFLVYIPFSSSSSYSIAEETSQVYWDVSKSCL